MLTQAQPRGVALKAEGAMPPPTCKWSEFRICSVAVKSHHIPRTPVGSLFALTINPLLESASERLPIHAYSGALD